MNKQEYENKKKECWKEFKRQNLDGEVQWQPVSRYDVFCDAFDRAYALGKQEKDADTVISGWVARDANPHRLYVYYRKPIRLSDMWTALDESFKIDPTLFPDLTWGSEPEPVEIIIKRKKNG